MPGRGRRKLAAARRSAGGAYRAPPFSQPRALEAARQLRGQPNCGSRIRRRATTYRLAGRARSRTTWWPTCPARASPTRSWFWGPLQNTCRQPGADDNASAVAVLLEVARLTLAGSWHTIRFVAFACEEMPHFRQRRNGEQGLRQAVRATVANEWWACSAWKWSDSSRSAQPTDARRDSGILCGRSFRPRGDFLAAVADFAPAGCCGNSAAGFAGRAVSALSDPLPEAVGDIRLSDNSSFWDQGYQALMLTDTSYLRNPHYHEPSDTPETLDYASMAQVTLGVLGGGRRWRGAARGEGPREGRWLKADGRSFVRTA